MQRADAQREASLLRLRLDGCRLGSLTVTRNGSVLGGAACIPVGLETQSCCQQCGHTSLFCWHNGRVSAQLPCGPVDSKDIQALTAAAALFIDAGLQEGWEPGQAFRDMEHRLQAVVQQRADIEEARKVRSAGLVRAPGRPPTCTPTRVLTDLQNPR